MKFVSRAFYTLVVLFIGWLGNFVLDAQFVLGVLAGWLIKEGYDSIATYILKLL